MLAPSRRFPGTTRRLSSDLRAKVEKAERKRAIKNMLATGSHLESRDAFVRYATLVAEMPVNHKARVPVRYYYKHLFEKPGDAMLDVGSWLGANLMHYADRGHEIDGIEVARPYVDEALKRIATKTEDVRRRIRVFCCLVEEFVGDRLYDVALAGEILTHVRDPQATVAAIYKLLKPGGTLFLAVPKDQQRTETRSFDGAALRALVTELGFQVQQLFVTHPKVTLEWGVAQWVCRAVKDADARMIPYE